MADLEIGDHNTEWKTAGDSVLGARLLAPPEPKTLLILGAGVVARSLIDSPINAE